MDPKDPERTRREKLTVGLTTDFVSHLRTAARWSRRRNRLHVAVVISIFVVLIMVLSSAIPSPDSWHGSSLGSRLTTDSTSSQMTPSSFYPYLANPGQYPKAAPLAVPTLTGPATVEPTSSCAGPIALTAFNWVPETLAPDGCALYTFSVSQSTWSSESGVLLAVDYSTVSYSGPSPALEIYQSIGTTPSPTSWLQSTVGTSSGVSVTMSSSDDAANIEGGWGTYEWMVVASASGSSVSYWFGVHWGDFGDGPNNWFAARIGISSGSSTLAVNFSAIVSVYSSLAPYTFSWAFGDGGTSTAQDPAHTYAKGGQYTVSLSAKDDQGQYSNSTLIIGAQSKAAPAELSLPYLANAVVGSIPTFMLTETATGPSNISYLYFATGTYNSTLAAAIYNGTASTDQPILWSTPTVVTSFGAPISGDDIAVSPSGGTIVIAVSSGGSTWVFESTNGGNDWTTLTPQSLPGLDPKLALEPTEVLVATWSPGNFPGVIYATVLSLVGYGSPQVSWVWYQYGETVDGLSSVWAAGTGSGSLGIVASMTTGSIDYYRTIDNGYDYTESTIGKFSNATISPVFNSLGDTRLADPNAPAAGAVTATAVGANVFVLYTTRIAGRTEANVTTSGNGGVNWNPTMTYQLQAGSVGQPEAVASPVGYVYVSWTDDSTGITGVDQAVFLSDGTLAQNATELPGSGGVGVSPASLPTLALDPLMRPLYAWIAGGQSSSSAVHFSGAFLSPANVLHLLNNSFNNLTAWDFKPSSVSPPGSSTQPSGTKSYSSAAGKLSAALRDPSSGACSLAAAQNASSEVYGNVTSFALVPVATSTSKCAVLLPAENPTSDVANTSGPFAPNTYLSVLGDWMMEGVGVQVSYKGDSLAAALNSPVGTGNTASEDLPPADGSITYQTSTANPIYCYTYNPPEVGYSPEFCSPYAEASVTPLVLNPTTAELGTSAQFPTFVQMAVNVTDNCPPAFGGVNITWWNYSKPIGYELTGAVEGHSGSYSTTVSPGGQWNIPPIYLTNLTPNAGISWSDGYHVTYQDYMDEVWNCGGTTVSTLFDNGTWTTTIPGSSGILYTNLSMVPSNPGGTFIRVTGETTENLAFDWNNTMLAKADTSLTANTGQNSPYWRVPESFSYPDQATGVDYTAAMSVTSQPGAWNSTQRPGISAGEVSEASSLSAQFGCSFLLEKNPVQLASPSGSATDPQIIADNASNKVTVLWLSDESGPSWLQYYELGAGLNWSQTASENGSSSTQDPTGQYPYQYSVVLQGLSAASLFGVTVWTSYVAVPGCLAYEASSSTAFVSPGAFPLSESDYPFDSISKEGGGASLTWSVAPGFISNGRLLNGTLFYENLTANRTIVAVPIGASEGLTQTGAAYQCNVTLPQPNTAYSAWLTLGYAISWGPVSGNYEVYGGPLNFTYERDTSGDGLTDLEKVLGWTVTTTLLSGGTASGQVTANPSLYATNGLVGDFVEKEFGLNPNTVDTAGSHMLDTWNLTFNLGSASSAKLPATGFEYYYENSTNPFASLSGGSPKKANLNLTNLTPSANDGGIYSGDGSPWAATVLWKNSALSTFENLTGVRSAVSSEGWLRATTGTWKGIRTITVWGKLSWGANPLATSTTNDGLADGNQPSPLEREAVQFNISSWSSSLNLTGDEAAPYLTVSSGAGGTGTVYYQGYGPAEGDSGSTSVSYTGPYVVSVPAVTSNQYVYYNLSINDQSNKKIFQRFNEGPSKVDLMNASIEYSLNGSQSGGSLKGSYTVFRVASAAPTLLWTPANNTTLSNVPWGLKRYTAEPDFDLLMLNLTSANTVGGIGGTQGGWVYSLKLAAGLNNLLVPRGAFLSSPLGQALLNNSNGTSLSGAGLSFTPTDWSGRVQQSTTSPSNSSYIRVFSTTGQSQNSSSSPIYSGLPSNSALETGHESLQVQSVIWINVSSSGNYHFSGENAELKNLFGGLVLNETDNLTGDLISVTPELGTLSLPTNVLAAMANSTLPNGGMYAPPQYQQPPPSPNWWQSAGTWIWNTISGVALDVTKVLSVVWNAVQSAAAYIGEAAAWLSTHLGIGTLANQFAKALKAVASAMEWALQQFVNLILGEVQVFIKLVGAVVGALAKGYANGISSAMSQVFADLTSSSPSATSIMASMGGLLLAVFGLSGITVAFSQGLSTVMSILQPILNLINPVRIAQVIGNAFGGNAGQAAVNTVLGAAASISRIGMGLVVNGLSWVVGHLIQGSTVPTLPSNLPTFPSGSQINNAANLVIGSSSSIGAEFGNLLSQNYGVVNFAEIVHVGLIIGVLAFLILNEMVQVSVPNLAGFLAAYVPAFGGELPNVANLPMRIAGEAISLVVSILSLILSSFLNWVWELVLEVASAAAAWFSGLEILLNPTDLPSGGGWVVPTLAGIGMGVSLVPPLYTYAENA